MDPRRCFDRDRATVAPSSRWPRFDGGTIEKAVNDIDGSTNTLFVAIDRAGASTAQTLHFSTVRS
jgi:hypothetical protein